MVSFCCCVLQFFFLAQPVLYTRPCWKYHPAVLSPAAISLSTVLFYLNVVTVVCPYLGHVFFCERVVLGWIYCVMIMRCLFVKFGHEKKKPIQWHIANKDDKIIFNWTVVAQINPTSHPLPRFGWLMQWQVRILEQWCTADTLPTLKSAIVI